ncbi:MAG: T9SS type A sorting domain-containing protein [Saprospiraceae bacterium]|nr:T9SS type A sorting domain-containing protein [Saprospiraceae bacterium]
MKTTIKLSLLVLGLISCSSFLSGQNYTSYFTGSNLDTLTSPEGGICMMGGATENDEAMKWFLQRAKGGDILVLRASGSNGYNNYLYSELGVSVNSVETIVFENSLASQDPYVQGRISKAEAIWFAGGDQWDYVSYWRGSPVDSLINLGIQNRNIVIGGTSAGMAILGGYYFSAENGTISSTAALNNPFHENLTISSEPFLSNFWLQDVVTDTHYDDPTRKGRHFVFLARASLNTGSPVKGIACDEYTSVCIDENGMARVFGGYPEFDDQAYFLQANCEVEENHPETISPGIPLTWHQNGMAVKVCRIKGTNSGENSFDLQTWENDSGGEWFNWSVSLGTLAETPSDPIMCSPTGVRIDGPDIKFHAFPNPNQNSLTVSSSSFINTVKLINNRGIQIREYDISAFSSTLELPELAAGTYFIEIQAVEGSHIEIIQIL